MVIRGLQRSGVGALAGVVGLLSVLGVGGCSSPLGEGPEGEGLRAELMRAQRAFLEGTVAGPEVQTRRASSDVERQLTDEQRAELDRISGAEAYADESLELGPDLLSPLPHRGAATDVPEVPGSAAADFTEPGRVVAYEETADVVRVSLQQAVALAVKNNLDVETARLRPAIAQAEVARAAAAFDAVVFASAGFQNLDQPGAGDSLNFAGLGPGAGGGVGGGIGPGAFTTLSNDQQSERYTLSTGIRQRFVSGATGSVETRLEYQTRDPASFGAEEFYDADLLFSLTQPLLQGFGADVNRSEIYLTRNAEASAIEDLRQRLLETVEATEAQYWDVALARQALLIQNRLLRRTIEDRDRLLDRIEYDVSPVRLTEANSFVELRRADAIRARQRLRDASDRLKQLINAPELPVTKETLLLTSEDPTDEPVGFSLLDSVMTALDRRPEMRRALLEIDSASIRQRVADNLRLPVLDLTAQINLNGLDEDDPGTAYGNLAELDYVDYILGVQFEQAIGNRGDEALYRKRRLERRQSVLQYQRAAQEVILEVKEALRAVLTNYELIGATRAARRAAADNLRAIEEQEAAGFAELTPEFLLDIKLQTQSRLADAETQEAAAIRDYQTAIARLHRVTATLLERNRIEFAPRPGP